MHFNRRLPCRNINDILEYSRVKCLQRYSLRLRTHSWFTKYLHFTWNLRALPSGSTQLLMAIISHFDRQRLGNNWVLHYVPFIFYLILMSSTSFGWVLILGEHVLKMDENGENPTPPGLSQAGQPRWGQSAWVFAQFCPFLAYLFLKSKLI